MLLTMSKRRFRVCKNGLSIFKLFLKSTAEQSTNSSAYFVGCRLEKQLNLTDILSGPIRVLNVDVTKPQSGLFGYVCHSP